MIKIELASYPKSGNNLLRHSVQEYFSRLHGTQQIGPLLGIQGCPDRVKNFKPFHVPAIGDEVVAYKSHIFKHPEIEPDRVVHIYRHPLDVFLSTLNYFNARSAQVPAERLRQIFKKGESKSVEELSGSGELDWYFEQFLESAGAHFWKAMLKKSANYFTYVNTALAPENTDTYSIRYEDMIADISGTVNQAFRGLLGDLPMIDLDYKAIDTSTRRPEKAAIVWKARAENYREFLTEKQIDKFQSRYQSELSRIGYL